MPRRIHVDPDLPQATIPARVLGAMRDHALKELPEECCGLLSGDASQRFGTVHTCANEMTRQHQLDPVRFPRDNREAFYVNEKDFLHAIEESEAKGETFTAVYHSHVEGGAYFSEMDQEFAGQELFPFPNAAHIVIAVGPDQECAFALFEWDPASGSFRGRAVVPGP